MAHSQSSRAKRAVLAGLTALTFAGSMLATVDDASAFGPRGRYYRGGGFHHRGLGVGAAVGLGVLGAAAAGVAASQYYNGYPVYPEGAHTGYGYDYYPDHGGYYGPY